LSRRRELGLGLWSTHAFDVRHSRSIVGILSLGVLLIVIFLLWVAVAHAIYVATFGFAPPESIQNFFRQVFTTSEGWTLIAVGNGVGFLFAVVVLMISVVSFPLLLDRNVSAAVAILTSVRVVLYRRAFVNWLAATVHRTCGCDARARAFELALVSQGGGSRPKPSKGRAHWAEITAPALRGTVSGFSLRWRGPAVESCGGTWPDLEMPPAASGHRLRVQCGLR
jgi:hypothetical protein